MLQGADFAPSDAQKNTKTAPIHAFLVRFSFFFAPKSLSDFHLSNDTSYCVLAWSRAEIESFYAYRASFIHRADTFFGVFFPLIWVIQTVGGRVTYGFHLIFHEEHDGGIRFGVASDFNQILTSKYQKNHEKQYKNVV